MSSTHGAADLTRYYDFHGVGIAIRADRTDLLSAAHNRFRHFAVDALPSAPALTFMFQGAATAEQSAIAKPAGTHRRIYGLSLGDIVYSEAEDLLYVDWGDGYKALCRGRVGQARIAMPADSTNVLWATHLLFNLCLFELLKRQGLYNIHAAGLSSNGQGLLFTGTTGSGKSTLTLALLRAGFEWLGDDTLYLSQEGARVRALAFPDEIDVTDQTIGFFPELADLPPGRKTHRNKQPLAAERIYPTGWVESCSPRVLIFPTVANTPTSVLQPFDPEQALFELASNIMFTEPHASQSHLDALAALVRQCDCYRLETGRDFDTLPERLRELLEA